MKKEVFTDLMGSAREALEHARGKRSLRTTTLPLPLAPLDGRLQRSPEMTQGRSPKVDHADFGPMTRASADAHEAALLYLPSHEAALLYLPSVVCAGLSRWPSPARVFSVGVSDRAPHADASVVASA